MCIHGGLGALENERGQAQSNRDDYYHDNTRQRPTTYHVQLCTMLGRKRVEQLSPHRARCPHHGGAARSLRVSPWMKFTRAMPGWRQVEGVLSERRPGASQAVQRARARRRSAVPAQSATGTTIYRNRLKIGGEVHR